MTHFELQALRKLFLLDVAEAAAEIGNVSPRSWQYWESGRSPVPDDVANQMNDLAMLRAMTLDSRHAQAEAYHEKNGALMPMNFYRSLGDYEQSTGKRNAVMWRLTQSISATLFAEGVVALVEFGGEPVNDNDSLDELHTTK